jgi:hypothetical protein
MRVYVISKNWSVDRDFVENLRMASGLPSPTVLDEVEGKDSERESTASAKECEVARLLNRAVKKTI